MRLSALATFVALVAASIAVAIIRAAREFDDMIDFDDLVEGDRHTTDPATWPRCIR